LTKDEVIHELLDVLPVLNFCSRPHLPRIYKARRRVGGEETKNAIKKGDPVELNIHHYVTIFLISILERDGKPCRRTELRELFLWKWPGQANTFEGTVMKRLRAIEAIHQDSADYPSTENIVTFTTTGKRILRTLRGEREKQIESMLAMLKIKKRSQYNNVVRAAQELADRTWQEVRLEASSRTTKQTKKLKLNKRGKKKL
jgi:hypothetical protein